MMAFLKKYWQEICVALLAAGFFIAASAFINQSQSDGLVKWSSPDETANYYFSKLYAETGELSFFEKANLSSEDIVRPRSMRSDNGLVKPVSFLGIILVYGRLADLISLNVLPYLTPFFAAVGIYFFYLLVRKVFGRANAFFSAWLLALFPAYFYYSVRSFFHNIPFVVFLIIGLYFLVLAAAKENKNRFLSFDLRQQNWPKLLFAAAGGLFVGWSLLMRASEALWVLPALFFAWVFYWRRFGFLKLALCLSFAASAFLPQILWNETLYGGFFSGGYTEMNRSLTTIAASGNELVKSAAQGRFDSFLEPLKRIKANIFYFGYRPDKAWQAFDVYFAKMFPMLFWTAFLGLILFLSRVWQWRKRYWAYLLSYLVAGLVLILYYGSWEFHDSIDPRDITIGDSYTRYWLPLYLGALPFASFFVLRLSWAIFAREDEFQENEEPRRFFSWKWPRRSFLTNAVRAALLIAFFYFSASFLFWGSKEGLAYVFANRETSRGEYEEVLRATEQNSIIITRYHDKLFFPARKVVVGLFDDQAMNRRYAKLAETAPVYYYNFTLPPADLTYLNERKLSEAGLRLSPVKKINSVFSLYRLEKK